RSPWSGWRSTTAGARAKWASIPATTACSASPSPRSRRRATPPPNSTGMRIAITMPQVPFVRGGAEILTDTLAAELRARGHEVETILIPYKWYPPERLVLDSLVWRQMDFTEANGQKIDLLLCTKYPSYLARHPNKRLWLYHQHRYIYD